MLDARHLASFPASCLRHRPADQMLLVGLGKPCLCRKSPGKYSGDNPAGWPAQTLLGTGTPWPRVSGTRGPGAPRGPGALPTTAGVGPRHRAEGAGRGAPRRCRAFGSCWCKEYASLPAGSQEEGQLEQRLFTFLSWLWAGQAIFKLFLFFRELFCFLRSFSLLCAKSRREAMRSSRAEGQRRWRWHPLGSCSWQRVSVSKVETQTLWVTVLLFS